MRILVVSKESYGLVPEFDKRRLRDFADEDEIDIEYSLQAGKDYIFKNLLLEDRHIDFIIVHNSQSRFFDEYSEDIKELAGWVRELESNYSSENFQIKSIPIILDGLVMDPHSYERSTNTFDLAVNLKSIGDQYIKKIVGKPLRDWLNKLGEELDRADLDLDFNFDKSLISGDRSFYTDILSPIFFEKRNKLPYLWIGDNIKQLYIDDEKFKYLLRKSEGRKSIRNEKEFHDYFNNNSGILLGDQFHMPIYEKHFYHKNSRRYEEPDYLRIACRHSFQNSDIFEVKLPNQGLINHRHQKLNSYTRKSVYQAGSKYPTYFMDDGNQSEIYSRLNPVAKIDQFDYTLLIGRQNQKEDNIHIINSFLELNNINLNVITYDELLDKYQRIYERVNSFNIR